MEGKLVNEIEDKEGYSKTYPVLKIKDKLKE